MKRLYAGLVAVVVVVGLVVYLNTNDILPSLEMVREERMMIEKYLMQRPVIGVTIFSVFYIVAVAFSLPIATPLSLLAGFLFGSVVGTIIVVVAATTGATIVFLLVRYFFYDTFRARFENKIRAVNKEVSEHGFQSILMLRLAPIFPFFLINACAGLTRVKLRNYVLATLVGIAPFSFVLVLAGERLGEIMSVRDVISFKTLVIVSLVVLAAYTPVIIRRRRKG